MSAYIVNDKTINAIVSYAMDKGLNVNNPQELATMLMNENVRSVNYRYNETTKQAIKFEYVKGVSLDMFYGAINCLNYQSCECNDYEQSKAFNWMNNALLELGLGWGARDVGKDWWGIPDDWSYQAEQEKQDAIKTEQAKLEARKNAAVKVTNGVEVAKLIRKVLKSFKKDYPNIKFSVKSKYSSVDVYWTDGPSYNKVKDLFKGFESGRFDGYTDYSYNEYAFFTVDNVEYYGGVQYLDFHRKTSVEFAQQIFDAAAPSFKAESTFNINKWGWEILSENRHEQNEMYNLIRNSDALDWQDHVKAETNLSFIFEFKGKKLWFHTQEQLNQFKSLLAA